MDKHELRITEDGYEKVIHPRENVIETTQPEIHEVQGNEQGQDPDAEEVQKFSFVNHEMHFAAAAATAAFYCCTESHKFSQKGFPFSFQNS